MTVWVGGKENFPFHILLLSVCRIIQNQCRLLAAVCFLFSAESMRHTEASCVSHVFAGALIKAEVGNVGETNKIKIFSIKRNKSHPCPSGFPPKPLLPVSFTCKTTSNIIIMSVNDEIPPQNKINQIITCPAEIQKPWRHSPGPSAPSALATVENPH